MVENEKDLKVVQQLMGHSVYSLGKIKIILDFENYFFIKNQINVDLRKFQSLILMQKNPIEIL